MFTVANDLPNNVDNVNRAAWTNLQESIRTSTTENNLGEYSNSFLARMLQSSGFNVHDRLSHKTRR